MSNVGVVFNWIREFFSWLVSKKVPTFNTFYPHVYITM